jgi:hypothetical protein
MREKVGKTIIAALDGGDSGDGTSFNDSKNMNDLFFQANFQYTRKTQYIEQLQRGTSL